MTIADEAIEAYRRAFALRGEDVTLTDGVDSATVRARVIGYEPHELVGSIQQGDRKVILLAEDFRDRIVPSLLLEWEDPNFWAGLIQAAKPVPKKGVEMLIRGKRTVIERVDDNTRRVGDMLVAYEIVVRG